MLAEYTSIERRSHIRHRARTDVRIRKLSGQSKMCRAVNLSAQGVGIQTDDMGLLKGEIVQLVFAINLGSVSKLHRRTARVVHVRSGVTGFFMDAFAGK